MYAIFDKNNSRRIPSVILCSPSGEKLHSIPEAKNRQLNISLTELSEFTFEVPKLLDEKGTVSPSYNLLETRRVISLEGIGQFIITTVETETDGIEEYKTVTCKGLEFEISSKNIDLLEASYSFYNPLKKEESLLDIILSYIPNWNVGVIDADLWSVKRYFDIGATNLYNFMMETVQESYECVFIFDTFNRTISAKKRENMITKTDIFMSYNNLVKKLKLTEDAEDIVTALDVCGDGDLTIATVNPLGTSTIYDFSYYATENWMTKGLINAITLWEQKKTVQKSNFKTLKSQHNTYNEELIVLKSQKVDLKTELDALEHRLALASLAEDSATCTEVSRLIEEKKQEITNKETQITNKENQITSKAEEIKQVSKDLSFENNFTKEQIKELSFFIYKGKIQNTNYAILDSMTYSEKQTEIESLFAYGEKKLKDVSQPTYTCSIDSVNFLNLIEYKKTIEEFELGSEITIEVDKERDLFAKMVLLGYEINLDDKTDLQLEFGNKINFKSLNFTYEDLFNKTSSISQSFDTEGNRWGLGAEAYDSFNEYKNNALNLLNQEIVSSENQEILINQNGIRGREWLENLKTYSGEQFWLNKNILAFSDDGFKTTKTAFGKIFLPDGSRAYGVIADALVGNIVYTKYLTCENENGSFKVDGGSVTIKNGNIYMTDDEEGEIKLEDALNKSKQEASKNLADAVLDITTTIGNMQEAIEDGMIDIFYQSGPPLDTDGKNGDLWYDISESSYVNSDGETIVTKKNEGYLKVDGSWQPIKDKTVLEALEKAHTAQDTADGKITSYYCPKSGLPDNPSEGDLWFDTDNKNKPYVYRGTDWVSAQDGTIADAQKTANDALNKVNKVTDESGNLITGALAGEIEAGKNNIICESKATGHMVKLNEVGIVFANSKTSTGAWDWKTAISANGIEAEAIRSNGVLSGVSIQGGDLNIGKNAFMVDKLGNVTISQGSIKLGTDAFTVDTNGNVSIKKGKLDLGNGNFVVDNFGDVTMKKGSININNNFTVNSQGDVVANSITLKLDPLKTTGAVDADTLKINNLVVGKNVTMGPDATISWAQVSGKDNVANKSDITWDKVANKPTDLATTDDITWANLGGKPEIPVIPSYIESTQITRASIVSPTISGEVVNSATFNGGVYRTWKSDMSVFGGQMDASGLHVYNGSTQIGDFTYTNENVAGNPNAVLIQSKSNYAMKISSGEANMSITGKKIYIEGTLILNGTEITGNGNAVFG